MRDDNMNPAAAWLPISNHRGAFTFSADIFFLSKKVGIATALQYGIIPPTIERDILFF